MMEFVLKDQNVLKLELFPPSLITNFKKYIKNKNRFIFLILAIIEKHTIF